MILPHGVLEGQDVNLVVARRVLLKVRKDPHCRDIVHIHWNSLTEGQQVRLRDSQGKECCRLLFCNVVEHQVLLLCFVGSLSLCVDNIFVSLVEGKLNTK